MGNDQSRGCLERITIDEEPILVFNQSGCSWSLHHGRDNESGSNMSVYIDKSDVSPSLRERYDVISNSANNLKLYRHPGIVKFLEHIPGSRTNQGGYLITEKTSPLTVVLSQQSDLQIRLGLYDVINALKFLHEVGNVAHNNVCQSAVHVAASDGRWRLGGMEFIKKIDLLNYQFLESTRPLRHESGLAPEEYSHGVTDHRARDVFSLGVLIEEVLSLSKHQLQPEAIQLLSFARSNMQADEPSTRPSLSNLLDHDYFRAQSYLIIVEFLSQMALKSQAEKDDFFISLTPRLKLLPEKVIASQLTSMLLSRLVLLEDSANSELIPSLLTPGPASESPGPYDPNKKVNPILSEELHREFVIPQLTKIFGVRDMQIRMVLLRHFSVYYKAFSTTDLEFQILPLLLLGIRDTDDRVVAGTLKALADIVPILGASTVIGKHRSKVFSDCSPSKRPRRPAATDHSEKGRSLMPTISPDIDESLCVEVGAKTPRLPGLVQGDHVHHESPSLSPTKMSERVPPIGAEDSSCDDNKSLAGRSEEVEREESDQNYANDTEVDGDGGWGGWGEDEDNNSVSQEQETEAILAKPIESWAARNASSLVDLDLSQLDIKSTVSSHKSGKALKAGGDGGPAPQPEDDLLADLEPDIERGKNLLDLLEEKAQSQIEAKPDSKLGCIQSGGPELKTAPITTSSIFAVDNNEEDGWGGGEEDELGLGNDDVGGWNDDWDNEDSNNYAALKND